MAARLYSIPGSHPSTTGRLLLERKRIPYRRVDLIPGISHLILRLLRFPGSTVPSLEIEGRRITGSREISRELDRMYPEPPLFPADPDAREAVEEAERWGDEVLQDLPRRIAWACMRRQPAAMMTYAEGARLGVPPALAARTAPLVARGSARYNRASDEAVRADLAALPAMLDRVDTLIADGVLGGEQPNAADFQIAASLRLLMTLGDLRPAVEARPGGALAKRLVPDFPGHVGPVLPAAWLEPLRAAAATAGARPT